MRGEGGAEERRIGQPDAKHDEWLSGKCLEPIDVMDTVKDFDGLGIIGKEIMDR